MARFDEQYLFDWTYVEPARAFVLALDDAAETDLLHLLDFLCRDPWEDGNVKTPLTLDDGTLVTLYDDGRWQVIYLLVASRVIEVWALSRDWFGAG